MSNETLLLLLPEILLVTAATLIYLGGAFFTERSVWSWLAAAGLLLAGMALYRQGAWLGMFDGAAAGSALPFATSGPVTVDFLSYAARWAILGVGLLFVLMAAQSEADSPSPEYTGSLLLIVAGLMIIAGANELVLLFLGLELVSIPTYVVLYLGRRGPAAQEATIKYFFLSILSSALLLYGFSFLYGVSGSTQLSQLYHALKTGSTGTLSLLPAASLGLVFVFAGLGFRLTAVPFHFYAPDVYQGTSNPNAGLLSTLPKIAGLLALIRIVVAATAGITAYISTHGATETPAAIGLLDLGWKIALALAILTMTVGNLLALWQDNIRRLLAYSSIAHGGYVLVGLAVGLAMASGAKSSSQLDGLGTALFYLVVYIVATTGTFAALTYLGGAGQQVDGVDELAGLGRTHPLVALVLAAFMFSLAGVPPLSGFWGKFNLFLGALGIDRSSGIAPADLRTWFIALAVVGVLNSAISVAYYLRIVGVMFFRAPLATAKAQGGVGAYAAMLACALLVVGLGFYPGPLMDVTNRAGIAGNDQSARLAALERQDTNLKVAALPEASGPVAAREDRNSARVDLQK